MALGLGLLVFLASVIGCVVTGTDIVFSLALGLVIFVTVAMTRGFGFKEVMKMAIKGGNESFIVVEVMLLIGMLTAVWRSAGTITFFVHYGTLMMQPRLFILFAFLLCCLLSYLLGTSFGVAGTMGVIIMTIARSSGADLVLTAGAVMSGIYFGDRNSPVSSSAILVANITGTDIYENVKLMFKTSVIPMAFCLGAYSLLSFSNPLEAMDQQAADRLSSAFSLSLWTAVPAVFMLVLPIFRIAIDKLLICSIVSSGLVSLFVQHMGLGQLVRCVFFGYSCGDSELSSIIDGGGAMSMVTVCLVVYLSSAYSGIFNGTKMLEDIQNLLERLTKRAGGFITTALVSTASGAVFCNQTIASIMSSNLMSSIYERGGGSKQELAIDIENSGIVTAGLVPWSMACFVPLKMMQVGFGALLHSYYLYLIPVCYIFTKRFTFKEGMR